MNQPLRAAIVDDEPLARRRLSRMLGEIGGVEVVGDYGDGLRAVDGLHATPADVLFLDIRMPEVDGFQLLERLLPAERPLVVFVSAYSERALEAFDVEAIDYLVKPLSPQRLREAVSRVRMWLAGRAAPAPVRPTAAGEDSRYPTRLAVPDGARTRMLPVAEIELLVAQGPMKVAALRVACDAPKAAQILQQDVYGWFERVERGVYAITPKGREGLERFDRKPA